MVPTYRLTSFPLRFQSSMFNFRVYLLCCICSANWNCRRQCFWYIQNIWNSFFAYLSLNLEQIPNAVLLFYGNLTFLNFKFKKEAFFVAFKVYNIICCIVFSKKNSLMFLFRFISNIVTIKIISSKPPFL